jgi:hypothetical protein
VDEMEMRQELVGHAEFYAVLLGGTLSAEPADPGTPLGMIQAISQVRPLTEADWVAAFAAAEQGIEPGSV